MPPRLRSGDLVEVRSLEEIRATLDAKGTLEDMPFMPEMIRCCGKRYRVGKRAHKTCNTVENTHGARVASAVHLEGVRCDGSSHDGCQAACLMFWKEAWLKPVQPDETESGIEPAEVPLAAPALPDDWSKRVDSSCSPARVRYRCQITELPRFAHKNKWWDVRQYVEDITSGNVTAGLFFRGMWFSLFRIYMKHGVGHRAIVTFYNWVQRLRGGASFPLVSGTLEKTPHLELHLRPGEWVRVKEFDAILATLDTNSKNRGLGFDTCEQRLHCNRVVQVKSRVERIINEQTGEMMMFKNPCITLDGVYCTGETTEQRLFCPRGIPCYWREIWLERAAPPASRGAGTKN